MVILNSQFSIQNSQFKMNNLKLQFITPTATPTSTLLALPSRVVAVGFNYE